MERQAKTDSVAETERSINKIKSSLNIPKEKKQGFELKENIISNSGSLGLDGIDIPISGSLSGKGRKGAYYTVDQMGSRKDRLV